MPMSRGRGPRVLEEDYGNGVTAVTVIGERDISYSVTKGGETVWSRTIESFGRKKWQARREAALEQDEVATREAGAKRIKFGRRRRTPKA